jgi:signal transduction histidine kinase/DNA-binding response OmpR family regulator/HAMP domain-containing protein
MNRLFKKLPLPVKLLLIGVVPMLFIIFISLRLNKMNEEKMRNLETFNKRIERYSDLMQLIDYLQAERRFSFNYVTQGQSETDMVVQRKETTAQINKISGKYAQLKDFASYTFLDSIQNIRKSIDRKTTDANAVTNYYTNSLFRVNTISTISTAGINYLEPVNPKLLSQKSLSEAATYLGILRNSLYPEMLNGTVSLVAVDQLTGLYNIYRSFLTEMNARADVETKKRMDSVLNDPNVHFLNSYLNKLFNHQQLPQQLSADQWLTLSAAVVDRYRLTQSRLLSEIKTDVGEIYDNERANRTRNIILLLVIIVVVAMIIFYTINSVNKSLGAAKIAAMKLAQGKPAGKLYAEANDAIGSLMHSMNQLDQNNHAIAAAADAIGRGNFDVSIKPRSKEDLLGNALLQMKNDLAAFRAANMAKLEVQTGLAKLSEALQGEKPPQELMTDALRMVAEILSAQYAVCYTAEDKQLVYTANYALAASNQIPQQLKMGETLIGETALTKKVLHLTDVPQHFLKVSTAAGESSPKEIVLFPLCHDNIVEGVIELGTLHSFPAYVEEMVTDAGRLIAIAVRSAKSRLQLQNLFEEIQTQSEELQTQHTELENINAELEAQTEKLQSSEEELKVQQEELLQANKELEERSKLLEERNDLIVERNLEIQKKAEELELTTKYKSEFLANMSHELRTPLNSILLLSRLLSENNTKNLTEEQTEYANVIQSSGHGLLLLIDEILDLSKIEAGKMELEYSITSAEELTENMNRLFMPLAKEKKIELNIRINDNAKGSIDTDKMRVEQILKNLISNAIKFTSKGGVTVQVDRYEKNPHLLSFSVKDTGIGIPKEKQAMVFEAFQQADGSTKRKFGGTGLGLSISKQLAGLLGGEIVLKSEADKGSEFILLLPENKQHAITPAPPEVATAEPLRPLEELEPPQKPETSPLLATKIPDAVPDDRNSINADDKIILIVEDDTNFAKALMRFTKEKGYKTIIEVTGDAGIEAAKRYKPTGVLLDIQLPVKDGWQVMDALKKDPATRHIPVHIMSSIEAKKESIAKGAIDFINKPVAFEQMNEILKKLEFVLNKNAKKVLIIEDNPKHAKALALFLETNNVKADIADSVNDGMTALQKNDMECVILDMGLPDMKAYETLEMVKKEKGLQNVPVIVFTGKTLSRIEEQKIKQYADSIVVKTAQSFRRIMDEVSIFLHLMEENKTDNKKKSTGTNTMNEILAGKKVLIADDDVRNIFSLTKALEAHKMQVITAPDGREAVNVLEANPDTDVILMDMMMPEMDGYEATTLIRRQKKFAQLPVIAVTAKAMSGDREKCIVAGASDYISKPVDIDQLISLLKVWLYDRN